MDAPERDSSRWRRPGAYPIIAGPTAGGKTSLAVGVALALNLSAGTTVAEVVSADSMLIYRGLDIGAAKPTPAERRGIPHHLIDIADPTDRISVHDWLVLARETIGGLLAAGKVPIVVGGTHLYIKALLQGMFDGPGADGPLRERLTAMDPAERRAELERADPATAARLHPNDVRRTIRALEVFALTGKPISEHQKQWSIGGSGPDAGSGNAAGGGAVPLLFGIDWPTELINARINQRIKKMIADGLVEEARALYRAGCLGPQAREALGYKQLIGCFEGRSTLEDAVEQIKIETRRFAKNQRTWLRRLRTTAGSVWIDASTTPVEEWVAGVIKVLEDRAAQCAGPPPGDNPAVFPGFGVE